MGALENWPILIRGSTLLTWALYLSKGVIPIPPSVEPPHPFEPRIYPEDIADSLRVADHTKWWARPMVFLGISPSPTEIWRPLESPLFKIGGPRPP